MNEPHSDASRRGRVRSGGRLAAWLLLAPFPVAAALFGAVHPGPRAVLAALILAVTAAAVAGARRRVLSSPTLLLVLAPAAAAVLLSGLMLLPVGPGLRAALQPGLVEPLSAMLELGGVTQHALALDPHRAVSAWGQAAAMVLLALSTALVVRHRSRRLRLAIAVVGAALVLLALGMAQRWTGAASIFWVSGIPAATRYPFFSTFVSHNHAGAMFAAVVPLAAALALRPHLEWRIGGGAAAALLAGGAVASASRGALVELLVGVAVFAAIAGGRRVAWTVLATVVVVVGTSVAGGLRHAARVFSESLVPGSVDQDVFGNRLAIWGEGLDLVQAAPLLGVGPGGFRDGYKMVKTNPLFSLVDHAHQEPLQALAEHGVVVGALWLVAVAVPLGIGARRLLDLPAGRRRGLLAGWMGCAAALLTGALFDFPLRIGALAVLTALSLGVIVAFTVREAPTDLPRRRRLVLGMMGALGGVAAAAAATPALDRWAPDRIGGPTAHLHAASLADWEVAMVDATVGDDPGPALARIVEQSTRALARRPLDAEAAIWLARARLAREDVAGAVAATEALTRAYPSLPAGWYLLAQIRVIDGEPEAARAAWRAGLALEQPDMDDALPVIERALSSEADPEAAATAILPNRADRLRDGAGVLARAGARAGSQRLFERAVALDRAEGVAYGNWLLLWGEPERAWAVLRQVPTPSCRAHLLAGEAAKRAGHPKEAGERFRAALAMCEDDARDDEARLGLARARLAGGDLTAASAVERSLEADPSQHRVRRELLAAYRRAGRSGQMVPHLEALVLEGVATRPEQDDLDRITRGLPPR